MKKEDIIDSLNMLSDDIIEETANIRWNKKHHVRPGFAAFAACFCLIFCTITVLAASGLGTRLINLFADPRESGFDLSVEIEKIPISAFTGDIREVSDIIRQQYDNYKPHYSWYPGSWQKDFSSSDAAREYIGFAPLKKLDWKLEEQATTLQVTGNDKGQLLSLNLETDYQADNIRLQAFSHIYTEYDTEEVIIESRAGEYMDFTESFYTTDHQKQCHVITSTAMESGYLCMEGYLVEDGVLYSLNISYLEEDAERAENLLHQWADLF